MGNLIKDHAKTAINYESTMFRHYAPQVLLLSEFLRSRNLPFIMWNSLQCWHEDNTIYNDLIKNTKEFYRPEYCQLDDVVAKGEGYTEADMHPNQKNHNDWADNLLDFYERFRTN